MTQDEFIVTLEEYSEELSEILSRFVKTRDSLSIESDDNARFNEIGVELIDLFRDELIDGLHNSDVQESADVLEESLALAEAIPSSTF